METILSAKDFKYKTNKVRNGTYGILLDRPGIYNLSEDIYLNSQNSRCQIAILILGNDIIFDGCGFTIYLNGPNQVGIAFQGRNIIVGNTDIRGNKKSLAVIFCGVCSNYILKEIGAYDNSVSFGQPTKLLNSLINEIKSQKLEHLKLSTYVEDGEDLETYELDNLLEEIKLILYNEIYFDETGIYTIVLNYLGNPVIDYLNLLRIAGSNRMCVFS